MTDRPQAVNHWTSRTSLALKAADNSLVFGGDPAEHLVPVTLEELNSLREVSRKTWSLAGLKQNDRVLVSTHREGSFPVASEPEVLVPLCKAVTYAQPRGRLRLLKTVKQFKPTVWVTTPCAALDFLARLYLEFNVDPFELGIEHIVLVGEIASPGAHKRLADEFESKVTDLYADPIFGAALSTRVDGKMVCGEPGCVALASLSDNAVISDGWGADQEAEIVLRFTNIKALAGTTVRTGQVVVPAEAVNSFHRTIGDQILARGRWLSLPMLTKALKLIDGIQAWQLQLERGEGTLDRVTLNLGLNRETLVSNPMWQGRIRESLASVTPLAIKVETYLLTPDDEQPDGLVLDQRGHHLGGTAGLDKAGVWQQ